MHISDNDCKILVLRYGMVYGGSVSIASPEGEVEIVEK